MGTGVQGLKHAAKMVFRRLVSGSDRGAGQRVDPDQGGTRCRWVFRSLYQGRQTSSPLYPEEAQDETLTWLEAQNRSSGYLFLNRYGGRITTRGVSQQLKNYAKKYGLDTKVVYPHSFRHRYAKNFLEKYNDIALLADLMGHESIETTRIYLRRTASEQQAIVDKIVTW